MKNEGSAVPTMVNVFPADMSTMNPVELPTMADINADNC